MKYALVTGASSGIGEQFVYALDKRGYTCILVSRRENRLIEINNKLKHTGIVITANLAKEEECFKLCEKIKDYKIDVFINNAGLGYCSDMLSYDISYDINMINVNIKAMHILLKYMLLHMKIYNEGTIINVASIAGLMSAGPYMSTYYATKSYVVSLTKGVVQELKDIKSNIYVGCLCPGPVKSEFDKNAGVEFSLKGISSELCVKEALKGIDRQKTVIIPTFRLRAAMALSHFVPQSLIIKFVSKNQKKKIYK